MVNTIVLAAGRGERFLQKGYETPKPFIRVDHMMVLEHCTQGIPWIHHRYGNDKLNNGLKIAVLEEHRMYSTYLEHIYGYNTLVWFNEVTRGNLETAYIVAKTLTDVTKPLYVFDCDNKFDVSWKSYPMDEDRAFGFHHEDSSDCKWSNVLLDEHSRVIEVREKDCNFAQHPRLIGIFGFKTTADFIQRAKQIIERNERVGNGEFYMSQTIAPGTHFTNVSHFISLGTPEDLESY